MKQLAFLLVKIFVFTAVPFGLIMSVCFNIPWVLLYIFAVTTGKEIIYFHVGPGFFLSLPIMAGALYGIPMALILGLAHYFQVRKIAQGKPFDLSPTQRRTLVIKSNPSSVFENCALVLQKFPARIIENDVMKGHITARTGKKSWKSWGDDIRIDVVQIDDISTQVKITCRPSLKTTLVDYGKNYENAEKLLSLISEFSQAT
jgi:hypothetical protein